MGVGGWWVCVPCSSFPFPQAAYPSVSFCFSRLPSLKQDLTRAGHSARGGSTMAEADSFTIYLFFFTVENVEGLRKRRGGGKRWQKIPEPSSFQAQKVFGAAGRERFEGLVQCSLDACHFLAGAPPLQDPAAAAPGAGNERRWATPS